MNVADNRNSLNDLLRLADPARAERAEDRPMRQATWNGTAWVGECEGANQGEVHHPRITLEGRRSFNCTCQDKRKHAQQVGPCKHVISLARIGLHHLWVMDILLDGGSTQPRPA
jgi:hypothetical protein